jgi:hypothetical protein
MTFKPDLNSLVEYDAMSRVVPLSSASCKKDGYDNAKRHLMADCPRETAIVKRVLDRAQHW